MLMGKRSKLFPVCDFMAMARMVDWLGVQITRFCLEVLPLVNGVTTDMKVITRFGWAHPIELNRINYFAP